MLFIHEKFLVYKLETFKNCKEVKHIMIMIIAIIYIFLSYVIFDQQLNITFRKSSASPPPPPWKNPLPLFNHFPLKIQKLQVSPPLFANIENFLVSPTVGRTLVLGPISYLGKFWFYSYNPKGSQLMSWQDS